MLKVDELAAQMHVGIVQTNLDALAAWPKGPPMRDSEQECAWQQIRRAFRGFQGHEPRPDIILLPELALPRGCVKELQLLSRGLDAVIIAGVDYRLDETNRYVWNEAVLIPPPPRDGRKRRPPVWLGKTWPAPKEATDLEKVNWSFRGDPIMWLFRGGTIGDFGVSICYDLMDLERALLYRSRIHHHFVLAYNKDTGSFHHHAESLMRTMYCNVVICNTGHFGGSVAVAPYHTPFKRVIYRHDGGSMTAAQIVSLPLRDLDHVQRRQYDDATHEKKLSDEFKSLPPNYVRS